MSVAALNEIGITLCMAFGLAVFYLVGRRNARRDAGRGMQEQARSSPTDAETPDKAPKEPSKGSL